MALNVLHLVVGKTRTEKPIICATKFEGIEAEKWRAGVVTVFDLRNLGESLASFEFTDS
jgi:hypothetical protein